MLTEALSGDPNTAAGVIGEALDKAAEARREAAHFETPRPARLLLAVDQAERLFAEAPKDADAFGALLQALAGPRPTVVMVMRADAYARFQACAPLLALRVAGATFDLMPPTAAELEEIVARPVAACEPPLAFGPSDPPLPQRLVADAKGGDALPLLQMTLEGLYKAQETRGDGVLRAEDYKGMAAAVTETANAAMAHLGDGGRKALEALVAGLVADVAPDPITAEPTPVVVALDRDALRQGQAGSRRAGRRLRRGAAPDAGRRGARAPDPRRAPAHLAGGGDAGEGDGPSDPRPPCARAAGAGLGRGGAGREAQASRDFRAAAGGGQQLEARFGEDLGRAAAAVHRRGGEGGGGGARAQEAHAHDGRDRSARRRSRRSS